MNRVVKTAVAVTAFGLAAALAVPAQAEVQYDTARYEGPGGGTNEGSTQIGGLFGAGLLNGLFGGIAASKLGGAIAGQQPAEAARGLTEAELDALSENQRQPGSTTTPNAAEDVTRTGGPLPELSPIVGGFGFGGGGLTESLPVLSGAARVAQPATPSVKAGKRGRNEAAADATTMRGAAKGVESLSADTVVAGLAQAAGRALPHASRGELSPLVGQVAPAEMAPVVEALPGSVQAASFDELTPLVKGTASFVSANGTKATGSYSDVIAALGWTTEGLTSSVRGSWVRD
ncbi:hypothetical protein ACTMTI_35335 [Nonomuraea sp. H19]|uniref:hypothetical protein n=1 Tax=Nonomuraea sp. H19 TaxID=3452206 RepID=UPI003F889A4C